MARTQTKPKTARDRLAAVPWALLLQGGIVVGRRVSELSANDRARLARLARESRGWPPALGAKERGELQRLLRKLDLMAMSRELLPLIRRGGKRT
ncbi:MAG TPA: hypothetical protein VKG82_00880 [Solirubrobacteraceae bacterium]|nr:hypothetical protein [Solirubrobacteraceae bacterium]